MQIHKSMANNARIHYDVFSPTAVKKLLEIDKVLKFHKYYYIGKYNYVQKFYDTKDNLLSSSGIILSKVESRHKCYFKVERENFLPANFRSDEKEVYIQLCTMKDHPSKYAMGIIDVIAASFGTTFSIDLENVIKNTMPKIIVTVKAKKYKLLSGNSFKAKAYIENIIYENRDTGRKVERPSVTVELDCSMNYMPDFKIYTDAISKYCKELIPYNEPRYEIAKKVTRPIVIEKKVAEKKAVKNIEG